MHNLFKLANLVKLGKSLKTELKIVFGTLAVIMFLPVIAVVALLNTGVPAISDALVSVNPVTHKIEIKDISGRVIKTIEATTAWPTSGNVTQEFGVPNPPYEVSHTGIDIAAATGTPITAAMSGTVTAAGADFTGGLSVTMDHGDNITSYYGHMSEVIAKKGQQVKTGELIGKVGATGWAFGSHVHFMFSLAGIPINPRTFMVGSPNQ